MAPWTRVEKLQIPEQDHTEVVPKLNPAVCCGVEAELFRKKSFLEKKSYLERKSVQ